jgi:serine/threonine protein kinase
LIDFGFARKYLDEDGKHIAFRENKTPLGTLNYMSLHVHQGKEPSRRDDMESVIYCMIYLYDRKKPNESDDVNSIIEYKKLLREREDIPLSWRKYLYYLDHVGFEESAKTL